MARIYLVRHAQAAAGWGEDQDPPLSDKGKQQAQAVAKELQQLTQEHKQLSVISSPILRAKETAAPFGKLSDLNISIETKVAEIPSPIDDLQERLPWLMSVMKDQWSNLSPALLTWRKDCIDYLSSIEQDCVIFSHYIAINVAIGYCQEDDNVICYNPDNTSIHIFENDKTSLGERTLKIVSLGREANTHIN